MSQIETPGEIREKGVTMPQEKKIKKGVMSKKKRKGKGNRERKERDESSFVSAKHQWPKELRKQDQKEGGREQKKDPQKGKKGSVEKGIWALNP